MRSNPKVREEVIAFLEEHPDSRMGDIVAHVTGKGLSTEGGIQSVMRNLVAWGSVKVDRTHYKAFLYSVNEEARKVNHVDAERFQVPAELAGPVVPPMVWSMRHLLGASA
ncbi:hypothetical protein [Herbaspirillum frisingense]|uniref:hypothetical protein n=1 Tax=Herbaspirillum frisingense TaxID=92645 RepID=UPI0039B00681